MLDINLVRVNPINHHTPAQAEASLDAMIEGVVESLVEGLGSHFSQDQRAAMKEDIYGRVYRQFVQEGSIKVGGSCIQEPAC